MMRHNRPFLGVPFAPHGACRPGREGFTLIELLVVIAIIGLLTGILLPSLVKVRVLSRSTACKANLRAVGTAFRMYLDSNNEVMPCAAANASDNAQGKPLIVDALGPNLSSPEALLCPGDLDRKVFLAEKSSYIYNSLLYNDGKPYRTHHFVEMAIREWGDAEGESRILLMNDAEAFHIGAGTKNFLFVDLHVDE